MEAWNPAVNPLEAPLGGRRVYSVGELTLRVKGLLEGEPDLNDILVQGEISNFKHHTSGHMYFTLKDERSRLKCVMFRSRSRTLRFRPEDGMRVVAGGSISVYEVAGEYQLYVDTLFPAGQGALHLAFEQLKAALAAEGLFAQERKRPLPFLPRAVGVVTSPTGAALRDIVSVLRRRHPTVDIVLSPAIVQGEEGPPSVVQAIERLVRWGGVDVLIVGRGGGSLEELWTFNDERVARAIAASPIPVISAVGHETDFTIADFVADRRAPTPSAAAEMAVPERHTLAHQLDLAVQRLLAAQRQRLQAQRERLRYVSTRPVFTRPLDPLRQRAQQVDELVLRLGAGFRQGLEARRRRFEVAAGRLDGLSPLATLARGYAICWLEGREEALRDAAAVRPGDRVRIRLHRGELSCRAEEQLPDGKASEG